MFIVYSMPRKSNIQVAKDSALVLVAQNNKLHPTTSAKYVRSIINAVKIDKVNSIINELNAIKSGSTAEAFRKSEFEKAEAKRQEKIQLSSKQVLNNNIIKQNTVTMSSTVNKNFTWLTHEMQIRKIKRETIQNKNILFSHQVKYYLDGEFNPSISNITFFTIDEIKKPLYEKIKFRNSAGEYGWLPKIEINFYPKRVKVEFITTAYNKIDSEIYKSVYGEQLYQFNDSGTCVYDAFYNFFENKHINAPKDKKVKSIFNKLVTQKDKYAKAYTDKNIHEIGELCSTRITIVDLINRENKTFNDNSRNYYNIELINSKYNHLELLKDPSDYIEVDKEKYNEIKNESNFYIERMGKLITPNQTYSIIKSEFRTIYDEWKQQTNYNKYYINTNSDTFRFIQNYDYTLHTFFDNSMTIDNNLYSEIDQKKAYYNCTLLRRQGAVKENEEPLDKHYIGFPSGSFITVSNITNQQFTEMTNNNLIGFFECFVVSHLKNSYHSNFLGFSIGSKHVLTTVQILFLQQYIQFDFINACYSPSVDITFNEKFLQKEETITFTDIEDDFVYVKIESISHYCKAFGLMLHHSSFTETKIKPYNQDVNYYKIINNETKQTYRLDDGTIKIIDTIDEPKNYIHFAYFMNSYCKTQNLKVMYENDIDQIVGVKVDSIVYKKNYDIIYDKSIFRPKETKIDFLADESNNDYCDLDFGIDIESSDRTKLFSFFRSYFIEKSNNINFGSSFLQTKEIITNRIILVNGAGGAGKSHSIIHSGLKQKNILYTSFCWDLIEGQQTKSNNNIIGSSFQKILGINCEEMKNNNVKYVMGDELTLMDTKVLEQLCEKFKHCFIFLIGDVDADGFFYQCSINPDSVIVPNEFKYKLQIVTYTKSYRFNDELNNRLNTLRKFMYDNKDNCIRNKLIKQYVYKNFSECLKNKEDIIFSDNDVGISGTNDLGEKSDGLTEYFVNEKNVKPQIFIKKTDLYKGLLKGRRLASIPDHSNYELKLFKTIHSFQGLDLTNDNKIIIGIKNNFDYNLFYTALSRARRIDQINIITNV